MKQRRVNLLVNIGLALGTNVVHFSQSGPQAEFFGIYRYGWLVKIYGCFLETLQQKLNVSFNISG